MAGKPSLGARAEPISSAAASLRLMAGLALAAPILGAQALSLSPYTTTVLAFAFTLVAGWDFHKNAASGFLWKTASASEFISFSAWAAFALSAAAIVFRRFLSQAARQTHWDFLCALLLLSLIGTWIESFLNRHAGAYSARLLRLAPKTGVILSSEGEKIIPVEEAKSGAIAHIRPGEPIPFDGIVASGSSLVDESNLFGRSRPMEKSQGAAVWAGSVNKTGSFFLRIQKVGADSAIGQLARKSLAKKKFAKTAFGFADMAAALTIPISLIASLTLAVIWAIDGPRPRAVWATIILFSVLAFSCPCALALSEPWAMLEGSRRAKRLGISIRRPQVFREMENIKTILIGKRGAITDGNPGEAAAIFFKPGTERNCLSTVLTMAERSGHPFARAVSAYAKSRGAISMDIESLEILDGRGLAAKINGQRSYLGSLPWLKTKGFALPTAISSSGLSSLVGFILEDDFLCVFIINDGLLPNAKAAAERMKKIGVEVVLVSGDRNEAAYQAAEKAGISRVFPEAFPDEKLRVIERLKSEGKPVAMIGEGFADAAALCLADMSIAPAAGSPIALGVADIVLADGRLDSAARAFDLGKIIRKTARENVILSLSINALVLPAAGGALYPHFGVLLPGYVVACAATAQILAVVINSKKIAKEKIE
ncbi:MAG: heavy metal translocating P-type ATPase [Elusimicrobiota bacterium]